MRVLPVFLILLIVLSCSSGEEEVTEEKQAWYVKDTTDGDLFDKRLMERNPYGLGFERGVVKHTEDSTDGYILYPESQSKNVYLINRNGNVVHSWKAYWEVLGGYLLDDGSIIVNASDPDAPRYFGGGAAGRILRISWDGRVLWNYEMASWNERQHHDIEVLPNGNVLAIAWEHKTEGEALAAGRDPKHVSEAGLWPDKIVELKPDGKYGAEVVWEWHIWDHLIQDFDPEKDNYGVVADHPELLDINASAHEMDYIHADSVDIKRDSLEARIVRGDKNRYALLGVEVSDMHHINAVDYNAELDQIAISSPEYSEIFIIDHSTTTEEARGHTGGRWGKGGDFLYRWGNPENYQQGDSTDRRLFYQHNIQWIEKGHPGEDHLILYNNNQPLGQVTDSLFYSNIIELAPETDENGNYLQDESGKFLPAEPVWMYQAKDTLSMWSPFISGVQRLKSGNTYITEGAKGRFIEVTPEGETYWEFLNPYSDGSTDRLPPFPIPFYMVFRSVFIPDDHPGLKGKELFPIEKQPEWKEVPIPEIKPKEDTVTAEAGFSG